MLTDFIQANKITRLATTLIKKLTVFASISTVSTEKASSVQVPIYAGGTLRDYTEGMKMVIDLVTSEKITIPIDQKKYINNLIDKVDTKNLAQEILPQVLADMTELTSQETDIFALLQMYTLATGTQTELGASLTPITVDDETSVKQMFKDMRITLKKNNIPLKDSFTVLPPEVEALAVELKAFSPAVASNDKALSAGLLGRIYGIDVYSSNNLPIPADNERAILLGSKKAFNVIYNYNKFSNGDGGIEYEGEYYRVVVSYGAGANNPKLLIKGVVVETGTVAPV